MLSEREIQVFRDSLYKNGGIFEHPGLAERQKKADRILERITFLEKLPTAKRYPEFLPHEVDQPLILTPSDEFDGMEVAIPPENYLEGCKRAREWILRIANHPIRMKALRMLQEIGFNPPMKYEKPGVIDKMLEAGMIPQLSDLGHNIGIKNGNGPKESLKISQVHRTELFAHGPFSFVSKKRAGSFVNLGAMPDIDGTVLMLETAAKMHMNAEVPEVGFFSDPEIQAKLAKAVLDRLNAGDPIFKSEEFKDATSEEIEFIVNHWKSAVVGVLEVNTKKALDRAEELAKVGVRSFRVYGHSTGWDVVDTVRELHDKYPDAEIFASQISDVDIAKACEKAGADAIIIGVGSGGRCTTAERAQLIPSNAALAWMLRGELEIPVIGEGGAVDNPVIAAMAGMSAVNGSGSIGGGTIEAPGGMFFLTRDQKTFVKPYGGEASDRIKWVSRRDYPTGEAYFSEGEQSFKELVFKRESMTQKVLHDHWERIILGLVFLGVNKGPCTISTVMNLDPSPLFEKSPTTQHLQRTH